MSYGVLKPGQGYWTRLMSAIGAGVLAVSGAAWLWRQLAVVDVPFETIYLQAGAAFALLLISGVMIYWLIGAKPATVDFLIATEGEMRKVNWSTRREIMGQTWVVIGVSLIIALVLLLADLLFTAVFQAVGVLQT